MLKGMFLPEPPLLTRRRLGLGLLFAPLAVLAANPKYRLIAHRGGIVDDRYAENSPAGTQAAIERGFWMLEVDIRRSKDGRAVMQHDADFTKFYGDSRRVSDMSWEEIAKLRATPGNTRPMLFEELVALCKGKVRLMLDVKVDLDAAWHEQLIGTLDDAGMLAESYVLGSIKTRGYFRDKALCQANLKELRAAVAAGEPVAKRYFLFEWGLEMGEESVALANRHGVAAVPSINWFHYERHNQDPMKGAERDIGKLQALGVTHFQIDSVYDQFLR
jgi:glycerophosphoryl diester phosphodiesterase